MRRLPILADLAPFPLSAPLWVIALVGGGLVALGIGWMWLRGRKGPNR